MALKVQHWVPPVTAFAAPLADAWRLVPGASCTTSVSLGGKSLPLPIGNIGRELGSTQGREDKEGTQQRRPGKTARLRSGK